MQEKHGLKELPGNLTIAIILSSQYLTTVFGCYRNSEGGLFSIVMIMAVGMFILSFLHKPITTVTTRYFLMILFVFFAYFITYFVAGNKTNLEIVDYIGMCLLPLICGGMVKADYKKVIRIIMYMIVIAVPVFERLFLKANAGSAYDAVTMGTSYALLPIIASACIHFIMYREEATILDKFIYVINGFFILSFIKMSYRGALVAFFMILFVVMIVKKLENGISTGWIIGLVTMLIVGIIVLANLSQIISVLYNILSKYNISIAFIDKSIFLLQTDEMTHGRVEIWKTALAWIWKSPLWGHGMTTFQYYTGYVFPHNFLLQFLFDGGILLTVPLLFWLISGIKQIIVYRHYDYHKFIFFLLIANIALTRAAVSAEVWRIIPFWLMMGLISNSNSMEALDGEAIES